MTYYEMIPRRGMPQDDSMAFSADTTMEQAVTRRFMEVMNHSPEEGLHWRGSAADLVELAHFVWEQGVMVDEFGRRRTFKSLVAEVCTILHVRPPKSPTNVMNNVRRRKNVRTAPILERYHILWNNQATRY